MRSIATTRSLICATLPPVTHSTTWRRTKFTARSRRYPEFMERYMKRQSGSHRLHLASSATEKTPVANSERLHSVLATLEDCRAVLLDSRDRETALLVSVAALDLRMKLHRITDSELKALCDAMSRQELLPAERSH